MTSLRADYLVIGAGATGMAFADALIDHADVDVVMVDRRHAAGGHWLDAYPFVRLHQASSFYGVASTLLGDGSLQESGPEAGLHERASAPEICDYYARVLARMKESGKVSFYGGCEYVGDGRFGSRVSGQEYEVEVRRAVVDASYLSPLIPSRSSPPFVGNGARVVTVNQLVDLGATPSQFVIAGSGKTATDACLWLLDNGVDPGAIVWVRPRDPWMLNRAAVQPDPATFLGLGADIVEAAVAASSPDDLFFRLEEAGVMLRIDPGVTPTMAKTPTLAQWELDGLRTIDDVVRRGHLRRAEPGRLVFDDGDVAIAPDSVVVHAAAPGLRYPPLVPIWGERSITLQPIRTGFPCFGAALAGYVEATIAGTEEKNRLCPPSPLSDTPADWGAMQALGYRATKSFMSHPDLRAWANEVALNPARVPADSPRSDALDEALARYRSSAEAGVARLAEFGAVV